MQATRRIFVVDDHPLLRDGLADVLKHESDLEICGWASEAGEAMQEIGQCTPDLAIVDLSLGQSSGFDLIRDLRAQHPHVKILVLSVHEETIYAQFAFKAGAQGYMTKSELSQNVPCAIRCVLNDGCYVTARLAQRLVHRVVAGGNAQTSLHQEFSDRELDVFEMLGRGCEVGQIASALHLSVKTVHSYCERMKEKLGLRTERELLVEAIRWRAHTNRV